MQAWESLKNFEGDVLVLSGDVPMLRFATVNKLLDFHQQHQASATVLTAILPDPTGYGRVVRNDQGDVVAIVEHKDATEEQRRIAEINSGIYVFDASKLFQALKHITPNNAQGEYYLTDVFGDFWKNKFKVSALAAGDSREIQGINTTEQLEEARSVMEERMRSTS